jgi:hypothetical protein
MRPHWSSSSTALPAKRPGTNAAADMRLRPLELARTNRIETAEVAITIIGSEVTSRCARYKASRAALPATN